MAKYPPYERISSTGELKQCYENARKEIISYQEAAKRERKLSRELAKDKHELQRDAKATKRKLVTLTEKQKAKDEATKCASWSGAATIAITLLYQAWHIVGFPGGYKWMVWWEHEAVYGVLVWCSTALFAYVYRLMHNGD